MASPGPTPHLEAAPHPEEGAAKLARRMSGAAPSGWVAQLEGRLVAWTALMRADLAALSRSWVLRGWVAVLTLFTFIVITRGVQPIAGVTPSASEVLARYLATYLFVWSTVIIVLGAGSVSLEADIIADSILSRACTRTQYITAKLAARALAILAVYALFSTAAGYFTWRYASNDTTPAAIATGIAIVGLAILLLVATGVAFSVLFNNTIVAVIGLLLLWYVAGTLFRFAGAEYLSPAGLGLNLPRILRDSDAPRVVQCSATPSSLTVVFSKDVDAASAEDPDSYLVWCPPKGRRTPTTAVYDRSETRVVLGGMKLPPGKLVKVTVTGVVDAAGNSISPAADTAKATVSGSPAEAGETGKESAGSSRGERTARRRVADSERPTTGDTSGERSDTATGKGTPESGIRAEARPSTREAARRRRDENRPLRVVECTATASSVTVVFSRPVQAKDAERLRNYVVESPLGHVVKPRSAVYDSAGRAVLLSGLRLNEDDPVKVTVRNVRDTAGRPIDARGNSAVYASVTPWKYVLGFGIPSLLAALLAVVAFSRRDL